MVKDLEKLSPTFVSFLSATSISLYMFLISLILANGSKLFGPLKGFMGPLIFLTLLGISVLVCGFLTLSFPFYVFWIKKDLPKALRILGFTTFWLFVFFIFYLASTSLR